jgi:hypothetical protein
MSYLELVAEVRRLPLHEQLRLMEELVHALQTRVLAPPEVGERVAPMSALRGVLKPQNGAVPTDEELRQIIVDDLLDRHA